MTPDERQMISDLFDRLRATSLGDKDREAEALINQLARATPDSAYKLVQSVLVMEHTLQEAGGRIEELEAQVAELQNQLNPQPQQKSGGSFLGGLFGGSKPQAEPERQPARSAGSVPPIGARSSGPAYGETGSPWGQSAQPQRGGGYAPQGGYPQQGGYPPQQGGFGQPAPQQSSGGGFMRTALTTAAGVAGGMLAAGAIRDMMGGGQAHAAGGGGHGAQAGGQSSPYEVYSQADRDRMSDEQQDAEQDRQIAYDEQQDAEQDQQLEAEEPQYMDPGDNDPGNSDEF